MGVSGVHASLLKTWLLGVDEVLWCGRDMLRAEGAVVVAGLALNMLRAGNLGRDDRLAADGSAPCEPMRTRVARAAGIVAVVDESSLMLVALGE